MNLTPEKFNNQTEIEHEWDLSGWIPDKPTQSDYGYVINGSAFGCSQEELISRIAQSGISNIKFVWTPEKPQPVFPEHVPFLVDAFKRHAAKKARHEVYWGAGFLLFGLALALGFGNWQLLYRNFFSVLGAVGLLGGFWELSRLRHYTQADAVSAASSERFARWLKSKSISNYTIAIAASLIVVGTAQMIAGDKESIQAAGLVKPEVWDGQWWRLLTCTLMHINFTHFWMNSLALFQFARIIEQTINRALMPIIFLISALCGSVFSFLLYPHITSVGASGGLMGLLGFMTIAVFLEPQKYPPMYLRRLVEGILFVGLLGVVGFAFIDNAAHLGGLCSGSILGWIFLKRVANQEQGRLEACLPLMGIISLIFIWLIAVTGIWHMF